MHSVSSTAPCCLVAGRPIHNSPTHCHFHLNALSQLVTVDSAPQVLLVHGTSGFSSPARRSSIQDLPQQASRPFRRSTRSTGTSGIAGKAPSTCSSLSRCSMRMHGRWGSGRGANGPRPSATATCGPYSRSPAATAPFQRPTASRQPSSRRRTPRSPAPTRGPAASCSAARAGRPAPPERRRPGRRAPVGSAGSFSRLATN